MSDDQGHSQQQIFEMLMESQYWSREQMQEYQRSQLEQMLRHAKANVPFYKTRLDCMFRRDGSINWDRWEEIPMLTKNEVRDNSQQLQAKFMPGSHGFVRQHTTSGTTSRPITILHTELEEEFWQANSWRAHTWWDVSWNKNVMRWHQPDTEDIPVPSLKQFGEWGPDWAVPNSRGVFNAIARTAPLQERLQLLKDTGTSYLHTRSSVAFSAALASEDIENIPHLEAVFSNSVNVEAEHEEECMKKFGARIHSSYSSKEAGRIGYSCVSNKHYHLCEESVLTEIVDKNGRTLPFGEVGDVLVTPYMCAAMPLIRYQQGDRAAERDDCLCGKNLRTISAVEGRTHFLFHAPSGQKFAASVPDWLRIASGVSGWQVAQVEAALIEVRYMGKTELTGSKLRDAHDTIFKLMRSEFEIQFKRVGELQETDAGKFIKYVNEYVQPK